ncbi:MAG: hypothetical protein KDD35_06910 [Bdellovibrionales bacterium]|nr:hypothetical protein [Bdellovibrionales bacterium]
MKMNISFRNTRLLAICLLLSTLNLGNSLERAYGEESKPGMSKEGKAIGNEGQDLKQPGESGEDNSSHDFLAEKLQFVDEQGIPLIDAEVLVGYEIDDPFQNNRFTTDSTGSINLPAKWKSALPLTVTATGRVRTTFDKVLPFEGKLAVSKADGTKNIEVKGSTRNFGDLPRDGKVDFGLVLPAFRFKDLFHFDLSSVISSESDQIRIVGKKIDLPSNLTLPKQTESYIIPIVLEKPRYRIYVRETGQHPFFAVHGQFPLKDVVDDIRSGKSVFEVVNFFDFIEGGSTLLPISQSGARSDLAVNEFNIDKSFGVTAPHFPTDKTLLSFAMASMKNGFMVPTDIKRLLPNQSLSLKTTSAASKTSVLFVQTNTQTLEGLRPEAFAVQTMEDYWDLDTNSSLKKIRILDNSSLAPTSLFNQLTFVFQDSQNRKPPQFLEMIPPPQANPKYIRLQAPKVLTNITPVATYLVLSEIESTNSGNVPTERRTRLWEVFAHDWVREVQLPNFSFDRQANRKYRWEVMYLGSDKGTKSIGNDTYSLDEITHVTRNAVDF